MEQTLTEGARRALQLASRLARSAASDRLEALHLLWALVLEESQAAEILETHGVTRDALADQWPLEIPPLDFKALADADAGSGSEFEFPTCSNHLALALNEAQRLAGLAGRHVALGSEHLLFGLSVVDSPARDVLQQFGLASDSLAGEVHERTGFTSEPIAVDVNLAWESRGGVSAETYRILDAAANRAREGIRVLEDYVRFTLDDAHLTRRLKECRHGLTSALQTLDVAMLLSSRDTRRDVGTSITTPTESLRAGAIDVVHANFKRVQEAFRSLEEFGKVVAPSLGEALEKLRYELYTLEKAVLLTHENRQRFDGRNLYLLVTETLCKHGSGPAVRGALAGGAGVVQLREKSLSDRQLLEQARRVRAWTTDASALFIVNDRPDIALLSQADGVHVGQDELSVRDVRRILGPQGLVGVSTHSVEQARQAVLDGADYLGVGPVFPSRTKRFDELAGLDFVRAVAAEITLPWYAIGGIDTSNLADVLAAGAARIAVSSTLCGADDPQSAASDLVARLRAHQARTA